MELKQLWRLRVESLILLSLLVAWLISILDEAAAYMGPQRSGIAAYITAVESDPNDPKAHFELARAYHETNDLAAAIQGYEQAIRLDEEHFEAYVCLASCYRRLNRAEESKKTWQRAFERDPDRAWKYLYLARGDNDPSGDEGAVADWKRATELRPDVAWPYMLLGGAYEKLQHNEQAQTSYEKARQVDPNVADWLLQQANERCGQRKWQEAMEFYTLSLKAKPHHPRAHLALGEIYLRTDNKASALEQYRALKEADRKLAKGLLKCIREKYQDCLEVHLDLGRIHLEQEDYEAAVSSFSDAVKISPDHAHAHVCLGEALCNLGSYEEAVKSYRKAIMLEPGVARTHLLLARAYMGLGFHGMAIESLKRARELDPDEPQVYYELGRFYLDVGSQALAVDECRKLKKLDAKLAEDLRLQICNTVERPAKAEIAEGQLETLGRLQTIGFDANGNNVAYFERLSTPIRTGQAIYGFEAEVLSNEVRLTKDGMTWVRKLPP